MPVFPDRLDLLSIFPLLTVAKVSVYGRLAEVTYGVPLMLNTLSWVSSRLMYPSVSPAKIPESRTKTGIRTP